MVQARKRREARLVGVVGIRRQHLGHRVPRSAIDAVRLPGRDHRRVVVEVGDVDRHVFGRAATVTVVDRDAHGVARRHSKSSDAPAARLMAPVAGSIANLPLGSVSCHCDSVCPVSVSVAMTVPIAEPGGEVFVHGERLARSSPSAGCSPRSFTSHCSAGRSAPFGYISQAPWFVRQCPPCT